MSSVSGTAAEGASEFSGVPDLLATFLAADGPDVTEIECVDGVLALDRLITQAEAARCAAVARFDANVSYVSDGMRTTGSWLRSRTELSAGHASAVVSRSRDLRVTPAVFEAYRDGAIGTAKVDALLGARAGVEEVFAGQEAELVAELAGADLRESRDFLRKWKAAVRAGLGKSDDGPEPKAEDRNRFHCSESMGRYLIDGNLDAASGAPLTEAINAQIDSYYRNGDVDTSDPAVTGSQLRSELEARAILDLVARGAKPGVRKGRPRPSVSVRADYGELLGLPIDGVSDLWDRVCELADGTPIRRSTAERLLCSADLTVVLTRTGLDGAIRPIGTAHTKRYPTANERAALAVRDNGCVFPGCAARMDWTDAHHIDQWHLNGVTDIERMVLLCRFHHHAVHEGGFTLDRTADGFITVNRPDGTLLSNGPPGRQLRLVRPPNQPPGETSSGTSPPGRRRPRLSTPPKVRPATRFSTLADRRIRARREAANAYAIIEGSLQHLLEDLLSRPTG